MTTWILVGAAGILGAVLLWGLVSPRTQWRVLVGWSARDPDRTEPGDGVHGITRIVCLIGLLGLAAFAGVQIWSAISEQPRAAPEATAVEQMWGSPVPRLADRVVTPVAAPPADLVPGRVTGFQELERGWAPDYLVGVTRWSFLAESAPLGLIGSYPGDGFTAYGVSDILVAVQGPLTCIPRVAAVEETEALITLGVYWGLPGAADQDHLAACVEAGSLQQTVLIPIQLEAPVDGRNVVTFEGAAVAPVQVVE